MRGILAISTMLLLSLAVLALAAAPDLSKYPPGSTVGDAKTFKPLIPAPSGPLSGPGTLLKVIDVPVPSTTGIGIGVAVDCNGTIYYTNSYTPKLFKTNANGDNLGSVDLYVPVGPAKIPISFGAISWDNSRGSGRIWGGTDMFRVGIPSGNPLSVYIINPVTGECTYVFTLSAAGCCGFCDGIGIDDGGKSIWVSDDIATTIEHWDVSGVNEAGIGIALPLASLTPLVAGSISGNIAGKGGILYIGRNGAGEIVKVNKSTGAVLGLFATPGGRDEDLECDLINFAPTQVLWSKDAYNDKIYAFEVESGTCACAGSIPTNSEWGLLILGVLLLGYLTWFLLRRRRLSTSTALEIFLVAFSIAFYLGYTI